MPQLFEPLWEKTVELRNRIVFSPIVANFGLRNDQALDYYRERVRGGLISLNLDQRENRFD